jgi:hypothetical protein
MIINHLGVCHPSQYIPYVMDAHPIINNVKTDGCSRLHKSFWCNKYSDLILCDWNASSVNVFIMIYVIIVFGNTFMSHAENTQNVVFPLFPSFLLFPMFPTFILLASQTMGNFYYETFQSLQWTGIVLTSQNLGSCKCVVPPTALLDIGHRWWTSKCYVSKVLRF